MTVFRSVWKEKKNGRYAVRARLEDGTKMTFGRHEREQADLLVRAIKRGDVSDPQHVAAWIRGPKQRELLDYQQPEPGPGSGPEPTGKDAAADRKRPSYELKADGKIIINRINRTITSDLGKEFGQVVVSFDTHASMLRRYSNEWEATGETIPSIARDFEFSPRQFTLYKTLHGWTHDSPPFDDIEFADGLDVTDAVQTTIESQKRAFHRKLELEKQKQMQEAADKWNRFEHSTLQPVLHAIQTHAPAYRPPIVSLLKTLDRQQKSFSVVLCPADMHFGKTGWVNEVGVQHDRASATQELLSRTTVLLERVLRYGDPQCFITAVSNDWFNSDGYEPTTTNGTHQDNDGSAHQILWEGTELAISHIDMLRQVAPVQVQYVAGNHDRLSGWGLLYAVHAWFHQAQDVEVVKSARNRQYTVAGNTLMGFTHGDGAKPQDLPLLMATEAAGHWGQTKHREWFTGHLHFEQVKDYNGVKVRQMPSLSPPDRWHHQKGYVGSTRSLTAYIVDHTEGVIATLSAPVVE